MQSEQVNELAKALSTFQGEVKPASMNATNPFLKNKYADLGSIIEAAKVPLQKNGLSVSQLVNSDDETVGVETVLMHSSGQWLSTVISLKLDEGKGMSRAQSMGSVITYLRRYSLSAILGVYADEDDDGNGKKPEQKQAVQQKPVTQHSEPDVDSIIASNVIPEMTLAEAMAIVGSDGKAYGDCTDDELARKMIGITKSLNKGDLDSKGQDEHLRKMKAIKMIQVARAKVIKEVK